MNPTITLQEAASVLNYKDIRSVEKWCERNDVKIFSEDESNKRYIMRMQFEYMRLKKFIQHLKEKYRSEWFDAFKIYISMDITSVVEMEEREIKVFSSQKNNYSVSGDNERRFLQVLTGTIHEL
jgi:hypothetical protein